MIIYESSVIVWIKEKGHIFNDVRKADKFYYEAEEKNLEPDWQRIIKQ